MDIKVKYFDKEMERLKKTEKGDWIDLRCVGGIKLSIHNAIVDEYSKNSLPTLRRIVHKMPITWKEGLFEDENGKLTKVKYFSYRQGDFLLLDLGIATKLPEGYEANIVPRSSTYKTFQFLQTNSFGVIDESYCGDNDKYFLPALCMQDGFVIYNERICQMRINKKMDDVKIVEVDKLGDVDRGGCGSSGTR